NEGVVDGMKCDERGNIYVTGPRGIWVFNASGKHLGVIRMPEIAGNLNWGGRDWDELYCACSTSIYRVRMKVRGNPCAYMRRGLADRRGGTQISQRAQRSADGFASTVSSERH